jgi:hypothetical protein
VADVPSGLSLTKYYCRIISGNLYRDANSVVLGILSCQPIVIRLITKLLKRKETIG